MISQFFVLSLRGDNIIFRDCKFWSYSHHGWIGVRSCRRSIRKSCMRAPLFYNYSQYTRSCFPLQSITAAALFGLKTHMLLHITVLRMETLLIMLPVTELSTYAVFPWIPSWKCNESSCYYSPSVLHSTLGLSTFRERLSTLSRSRTSSKLDYALQNLYITLLQIDHNPCRLWSRSTIFTIFDQLHDSCSWNS